MRHISVKHQDYIFAIGFPNSVAFMYSPQPVCIDSESAGADSLRVSVTLTHSKTGRSHTETRSLYQGRAHFDVSGIMQLLAPDVDELFQRLDYYTGQSLAEAFRLEIKYTDTEGAGDTLVDIDDIIGLYGSLAEDDVYGRTTQRRLWLNFPQTFNLWDNETLGKAFIINDSFLSPEASFSAVCCECNLLRTLRKSGSDEDLASLIPGHTLNEALTWRTRLEGGDEYSQDIRGLTLVPDDSTEGTYLRWLNRRGEVSYWLFKNSELRVGSAVDSSFRRFYRGDDNVILTGAYQNPLKRTYKETREMIIGAVGLSREEYEDLCDLAVSPLVERLLPPAGEDDIQIGTMYDGGDADGEASSLLIDGQKASETSNSLVDAGSSRTATRAWTTQVWQRVNVAGGTYSRNIRRDTPHPQDLEFIIELPERNTIKL